MKRLVLVEAYHAPLAIGPDDTAVALTATACFELESLGLSYRTPADFGAEDRLRAIETLRWHDLVGFLSELDVILGRDLHRPHQPFGLATLYGYHLKLVVDETTIRWTEANAILDSGFDQVRLMAAPTERAWPAPHYQTADLWSHICRERGLKFEAVTPERRLVAIAASKHRTRSALRRVAKSAYEILDTPNWSFRRRRQQHHTAPLTLLFPQPHDDALAVMRESLQQGDRCLVLRADGDGFVLTDHSSPPIVRLTRAEARFSWASGRGNFWEGLADQVIGNDDLWRIANAHLDVDLRQFLGPWIKTWITDRLRKTVELSSSLATVLSDQHVDFVVTAATVNDAEITSVAAAQMSPHSQTVLIAHGDGPDDAKAWAIQELLPYDHYFVPNREFADYFRQMAVELRRPAALVHVGSKRWPNYCTMAKRPAVYVDRWDSVVPIRINRPPAQARSNESIALYVCSLSDGEYRYLHKPAFSEPQYYQLQTRIIETIRSCHAGIVIVKVYPRATAQAVSRFVEALRDPRVRVSRTPLSLWLPWVDRVILDKPSTTLYQVALAGVDFHLLVSRQLPMRAAALEPFDRHLSHFGTLDEAAEAVRRYLSSAPCRDRARIYPESDDILGTLRLLKGGHAVSDAEHRGVLTTPGRMS